MRSSCVTRNYQEKSRAVYPGAGLGGGKRGRRDNAGKDPHALRQHTLSPRHKRTNYYDDIHH